VTDRQTDRAQRPEAALANAWDGVCHALAWAHAALARWLGGAIAWLWQRQARWPLGAKFGVAFTALGLLAIWCAWFIPGPYATWASWGPERLRLLERAGVMRDALLLRAWAWIVATACLATAFAACFRRAWVLWALKAAWAAWLLLWTGTVRWALVAPAALNNADFRMFDNVARNALWAAAFGYGLMILLIPSLVLLGLALADTRRWYAGRADVAPQSGDRFVASLRTGGQDPRYRSSTYWSLGIFLSALVLPLLIRGCGWDRPYGLVKGSGEPQIQVITVKRPKPKKKEKKLVVNAWSPYIFDRMKIDDVKVLSELTDLTMDTYQVQAEQRGGKLGKGGGKSGGWPKGMEGATVRFIRLQYTGGDWDQDMGKGADYNLLLRFHQITGFPIARETESREIDRLRLFPKHKAPPFVFLTGRGNLTVTDREAKTLRWYLETEGGMLFIDNGGGHFDRSVRSLLSSVLPGKPLVDIANDDPIFRAPFVFADGAPPFWHHAGSRALGVKVDGRWAVFYHPGDVNDAWKDGHSGATKEVADQAYKLGINVMYHAFNAYYRRHYEDNE
jgi:hypothetical protein